MEVPKQVSILRNRERCLDGTPHHVALQNLLLSSSDMYEHTHHYQTRQASTPRPLRWSCTRGTVATQAR